MTITHVLMHWANKTELQITWYVMWLGTQHWFKDPTVGSDCRFDFDLIEIWLIIQNLESFYKYRIRLCPTRISKIFKLWFIICKNLSRCFVKLCCKISENHNFAKSQSHRKITFSTLLQHLSTPNNNSWWQAPLVCDPPILTIFFIVVVIPGCHKCRMCCQNK